MRTRLVIFVVSVFVIAALAWGLIRVGPTTGPAAVTFPSIDPAAVLGHTKALSSDEFEGRAPATRGEERTVTYLADRFREMGLKPAAANGSYFQPVPLVGITPEPSAVLTFARGMRRQDLAFKTDFVAWTKHAAETVGLDRSEMVFVGYGARAPEFDWDDYKGIDLAGKTMVVLIGDPPVPDAADAAKLDPKSFGGTAMTYYGRWTYKMEMAQKMGAAGVLIVHETAPAGYAYSVVQVKVGEQFDIATPDKGMSRAVIEGWIPLERARALFALAGKDFDEEKRLLAGGPELLDRAAEVLQVIAFGGRMGMRLVACQRSSHVLLRLPKPLPVMFVRRRRRVEHGVPEFDPALEHSRADVVEEQFGGREPLLDLGRPGPGVFHLPEHVVAGTGPQRKDQAEAGIEREPDNRTLGRRPSAAWSHWSPSASGN